MITQNPIVGRSRKKLAGVYARTLWNKNIIQSCPSPSTVPPSRPLRDSRAAFAVVSKLANMIPASFLNNIYYSAPIGRSRRAVLNSQLFTGVLRENYEITYNPQAITELGTNPIVTRAGLLYTASDKNFTIAKSEFDATELADTSRVPLVFALSYDLCLCVPLLSYTEIDEDNLVFSNMSDTFLNQQIFMICLWQTNIGTTKTPIWQFGSFKRTN